MADLEFEDFEGGDGTSFTAGRLNRAKRLVNLAGAVCSVGLLAGLCLWGYQLAVRDVAGVPVMRALAGPMRLAPVDPGGDQASHQGLSVNAVAATGSSAPVADQLTLAPRPVELLPGDTSGLGLAEQADTVASDLVPVSLSISGQASPGTPQTAEVPPLEDGAGSLIDTETGQAVELVSADVELPAGAAVMRSLRPQARPAALSLAEAPATPTNVETVSAPAPLTELDPASLEVGTRLAQLGAFDSHDLARAKYQELQGMFAELMAGKAMVVQSAQSGGRTFYRLRAHGFPGDDEARRFCAALQAQNTDCIPVAQR
jgi:hypothetical protein